MSNLAKFLSLIVFVVAIWSVNSFLLPRVKSDISLLSKSKKELAIKQSFNENSPANLSKSMNEFVLKEFDKNQVINLIEKFANESGIVVSSLDIQAVGKTSSGSVINDESLDKSDEASNLILDEEPAITSTLKSVNLNLDIKGSKNSIDSFIDKLSNSKQYIDIQDINISFNNSDKSVVTELNTTINAIIYYVKI
jgi:hypothetical protein